MIYLRLSHCRVKLWKMEMKNSNFGRIYRKNMFLQLATCNKPAKYMLGKTAFQFGFMKFGTKCKKSYVYVTVLLS